MVTGLDPLGPAEKERGLSGLEAELGTLFEKFSLDANLQARLANDGVSSLQALKTFLPLWPPTQSTAYCIVASRKVRQDSD